MTYLVETREVIVDSLGSSTTKWIKAKRYKLPRFAFTRAFQESLRVAYIDGTLLYVESRITIED